MSRGRRLLEQIASDLLRGSARTALLGAGPTAELRLDSAEGLARYADMIRPNIAAALRRNRTAEWLIYALLLALFAVATALAVIGNLKGWAWTTSAGTIPGLGITAAWPIRTLVQLRRENLKFVVLPELLALVSPGDVSQVVQKLILRTG